MTKGTKTTEGTEFAESFRQEDGGGWIGEGETFFIEAFQNRHVDLVFVILQSEPIVGVKPDEALYFQGEVRIFGESETWRFAWNHDIGHACADIVDDFESLLHLFRRGLIDETEGKRFSVKGSVAEIVQLRVRDDAVGDVDKPSFEGAEADAAQADLFDGAFRVADFDPVAYLKQLASKD